MTFHDREVSFINCTGYLKNLSILEKKGVPQLHPKNRALITKLKQRAKKIHDVRVKYGLEFVDIVEKTIKNEKEEVKKDV